MDVERLEMGTLWRKTNGNPKKRNWRTKDKKIRELIFCRIKG